MVRSVPPPPPPPVLAPALAYAGAPAAGFTFIPATAPQPVQSRHEIKWRWPHLWLFGLFAWGIPTSFMAISGPTETFSSFLDRTLFVQIACYILAAVVAYVLVHKRHDGDWSTLGISFSDVSYDEVLKGGLFGLALVVGWLPVGMMLDRGRLRFDPMIQMLVGGTSAIGLLFAIIVVVVGAPIIEEIYYRGMLYEKFARRSRGFAIIGTSLLFVMAHGALLIPPLLLLAFGLAWKRRTHGLWFTMSAHAVWNLVVICLAAVVLFGPAKAFTPADGAYSVRYDSGWQRIPEVEAMSAFGVTIDLALTGPDGSFIEVIRVDLLTPPGRAPGKALAATLNQIQQVHDPRVTVVPSTPVPYAGSLGGPGVAYEITNQIEDPTYGTGQGRKIAVLPSGWDRALIFEFICPTMSCEQAAPDFESLLTSFSL